jgi:hypothetical protein
VLPPPFIALRELYGLNDDGDGQGEPSILVAGERTPLFGLNDPSVESLYDSVFDFLRREFTGHRWIFKPRAGLTDVQRLNLDGFDILPADFPFEELCLRNCYRKVISVRSTASKVAAYFGQPSYLLYRLFHVPPILRQLTEAYFSPIRSINIVEDLRELMGDPPESPRIDLDVLSRAYRQVVVTGSA